MQRLIKLLLPLFILNSCHQTVEKDTKLIQEGNIIHEEIRELEFVEIRQLGNSYNQRFDLSGICFGPENSIWAVADKSHNTAIYQLDWAKDETTWEIISQIDLEISDSRIDFEALDYADSIFYISNEVDQSFFTYNLQSKKLEKVTPPYLEADIHPNNWKMNTGLEGLAIDSKNNIAYLGKEREPRMIYTFDRSKNKIIEAYDFPHTHSNDIGDLKYENNFLYVLERNGNYITKIDLETQTVVDKLSYRSVCSAPEGKLFDAKYGMAEALLLSENEIWIGLDNNADSVTDFAKEKYKLKGNKPAIIRFKRPLGF
ncbi:esterase-like activity of phytase family protein [Sediminitomix flava]|uniref:SdiA-regulated protein n=1 Tax=Sediminitomix flava TaxID=379075 RepID=A0A315Z6R3_SEDFL|nr:esterase-like activity of phytase family protein [Sediminitomix flava]PWJ39221.1 SdiA-regulated protein [Sediminitomix flava]